MRICLLLALVFTGAQLNAAERPNVIVILVDDNLAVESRKSCGLRLDGVYLSQRKQSK